MIVKANTARKKTVRAIQTQRAGSKLNSSTKNTAVTWAKVFALPKILGRKSRNPAIAYSTALTARIEISRLNTSTVNFHGIWCRIESTRNIVLISSLTAAPLRTHGPLGNPRRAKQQGPRLSWKQTAAKAREWSHPANPLPCVPRGASEKIRHREKTVHRLSPWQQNPRTRPVRCPAG